MALLPFRLPDIGEGIAEAEVVEWHAAVGDTVAEGQVIVSVMTDKATVEMEAPAAGTLIEQGAAAGSMLAIGATLFVLDVADEDIPATPDAAAADLAPLVATPAPVAPMAPVAAQPTRPADRPPAARMERPNRQVLAAPAVRHRARQLGIDLSSVPAVGERVSHEDLDRFILSRQPAAAPVEPLDTPGTTIPVTGLRRQIARRMEEAKRHIPHFTYVDELDVTALEMLRERRSAQYGQRLSVLHFLIAAMCQALRAFPMLNAHYDDSKDVITQFDTIDLGIATQTEKGLLVPVLRHAQNLDVEGIAHAVEDLANRTRNGEVTREDLRGSTITVTSLGKLGGIAATPIINRPEVAIVAPNRIIERLVPCPGGPEVRKLMNMSISCDHRVIDGFIAASFIQEIKRILENPEELECS